MNLDKIKQHYTTFMDIKKYVVRAGRKRRIVYAKSLTQAKQKASTTLSDYGKAGIVSETYRC